MPIDYAAVKREYPKFKSALTRAKNRKDWQAVIKVVDEAEDRLSSLGALPDSWGIFSNARNDAVNELRRAGVLS